MYIVKYNVIIINCTARSEYADLVSVAQNTKTYQVCHTNTNIIARHDAIATVGTANGIEQPNTVNHSTNLSSMYSANTKGEDTKGENTKGEDTKGEDTKGEDTKGEDTKGEDTKGEDTKGEDTKGEDTKGEHTAPANWYKMLDYLSLATAVVVGAILVYNRRNSASEPTKCSVKYSQMYTQHTPKLKIANNVDAECIFYTLLTPATHTKLPKSQGKRFRVYELCLKRTNI
jgi:hypothetical protein